MKYLVVSASQRFQSQSAKVAEFITREIKTKQLAEAEHLELCGFNLPFWDGEQQNKGADWQRIETKVTAADALVLITPEWGGMATPLLKNFLLMCDSQHTAHKPVLLVAVVSGISGAYPISELRMNAMKNNKLVAVPDHLIVRDVEKMLNPECDSIRDARLRERIGYSLHMLAQYAAALAQIRFAHRDAPFPKQQEYCYGM